MKEEKSSKREITLLASDEKLAVEFVDLVQCNGSDEIVILDLIQRVHQKSSGEERGRLAARYAFTWGHLERTRDLFTRLLDDQKRKRIAEKGEEE